EHRAAIVTTFSRLDAIDHYALLEVARDADKKAIKRAYYAFASRYHPDRFFRKRLGTYRAQMEAIFARGTTAHDVLTSKDGRATYAARLGAPVPIRPPTPAPAPAPSGPPASRSSVTPEARATVSSAPSPAPASMSPGSVRAASPAAAEART